MARVLSPQLIVLGLATLLLAAAAFIGFLVVRFSSRTPAREALGRGHYRRAVSAADLDDPEDVLAAAIASKHMLELERAEQLLSRALASSPDNGEAWLERGLVAAYRGDYRLADAALLRAAALRSDLSESLTLHRAWVALGAGDRQRALRLFDEISAPLETKLRTDLGSGDLEFSEWFLQAADLWQAGGDPERSQWARREARRSAPTSLLIAADRSDKVPAQH